MGLQHIYWKHLKVRKPPFAREQKLDASMIKQESLTARGSLCVGLMPSRYSLSYLRQTKTLQNMVLQVIVAQNFESHDGWKSRYCMLVCSSLSLSSVLSHSCAATESGYPGGAHWLFVAGEAMQGVQTTCKPCC